MTRSVYRCFDADGVLLYVGSTIDVPRRMREHGRYSPWFGRMARVEVTDFQEQNFALEAERGAIKEEGPKCNLLGNPDPDLEFLAEARSEIPKPQARELTPIDLESEQGREILSFVRRIEAVRVRLKESKRREAQVFAELRALGYPRSALGMV